MEEPYKIKALVSIQLLMGTKKLVKHQKELMKNNFKHLTLIINRKMSAPQEGKVK
jgi:hypothetical protein